MTEGHIREEKMTRGAGDVNVNRMIQTAEVTKHFYQQGISSGFGTILVSHFSSLSSLLVLVVVAVVVVVLMFTRASRVLGTSAVASSSPPPAFPGNKYSIHAM